VGPMVLRISRTHPRRAWRLIISIQTEREGERGRRMKQSLSVPYRQSNVKYNLGARCREELTDWFAPFTWCSEVSHPPINCVIRVPMSLKESVRHSQEFEKEPRVDPVDSVRNRKTTGKRQAPVAPGASVCYIGYLNSNHLAV